MNEDIALLVFNMLYYLTDYILMPLRYILRRSHLDYGIFEQLDAILRATTFIVFHIGANAPNLNIAE